MGLPRIRRRANAEPDFYKQLHPELKRRVSYLMDDLRERGWNPYIPEVFGETGTGYRSPEEQAKLKKDFPDRTESGDRSFHIIRSPNGSPESMAVHITERSVGANARKGDPFVEDLEALAERHGLRTGNRWKGKRWDPLHVQLYEKSQLTSVLEGARPNYLAPGAHLLPPSFGKRPWELTPKTPNQLDGRFNLIPGFGWPPRNHMPAPPPIASGQWEAGKWMRLIPPPLGGTRSQSPPWVEPLPPFRSSPPIGIGFKGFGLSNTLPWPHNCFGGPNYDALTRRLTPPTMSLVTASGGAFRPFLSAANLGDFQLRPPNLGA